jgi:hypothetical protein
MLEMKTALVMAEGDPYLEDFATAFGRLSVNLIVLENEVRHALYRKHDEGTGRVLPTRFVDLPAGTSVPINWLTCDSKLADLIIEFNKLHPKAQIDGHAVVGLRNALAHGRILSQAPDPVLHLLRFPRHEKTETATVLEQNIPLTVGQLREWSCTVASIVKSVRDGHEH